VEQARKPVQIKGGHPTPNASRLRRRQYWRRREVARRSQRYAGGFPDSQATGESSQSSAGFPP